MLRVLSLDEFEFEAAFPDEEACWRFLVRTRWPHGYRCPRCGHDEASLIRSRRLFECKECRYQASVKAGTVFQDAKLPLRTWFRAVHLFATTKKGVSACELQRKLGIKTYRAAWLLHAKIQRAQRRDAPELHGLVEVDETFVGAVSPGRGGRGSAKAVVALAVEHHGEHAGRMAAMHVQDASHAQLRTFTEASIEPGSIVSTDGWAGYPGLEDAGFTHTAVIEGDPRRAPVVLPRVHELAGNLKRVLDGTHAGRVSKRHLHAYLDEFAFRFNHRGWLQDAFGIALHNATRTRPSPYRLVVS